MNAATINCLIDISLFLTYDFLELEWVQQEDIIMPKCECGGEFAFSRYCGADVCLICDCHKGMARCFCGWALSGGNGRAELEEMGEVIEPEDY